MICTNKIKYEMSCLKSVSFAKSLNPFPKSWNEGVTVYCSLYLKAMSMILEVFSLSTKMGLFICEIGPSDDYFNPLRILNKINDLNCYIILLICEE